MALRGTLLALLTVFAGVAARPATGHAQDSASNAAPAAPQPGATLLARDLHLCAACPPKRPLRAVLEELGINVFVNKALDDWIFNFNDPVDGHFARVGLRSWSANLRRGWVWDADAFQVNMFGHPFTGGLYFKAGRSNGLNFWESVPLTFLGSAEWEYFGETTLPSLNDFYNTGFGGIVLGEMTWRLAALVRDNRARGAGRFFRELAALPLDPVGTVKRLLAGDFTRVSANPSERDSSALGLELKGGPRLAVDSGPGNRRAVAGTLVAELSYGDAFAKPYAQPFDVFVARLLLNAGGHPINEMRVAGRLFAHEFTNPSAAVRTFFAVNQKIEYIGNPAYKFGGQSLTAGLVSGFTLGNGFDVRAEGFGEGIMLGAVDAPGAGIQNTARTYDFGPGVGFDVGAALRYRTFPVLSAHWHWTMVHSVSGSPADHYVQLPSVEIGVPVARSFGVGAYAGWYLRHSDYAGRTEEVSTYPDLRIYLTWQTRPRPPRAEVR